MFKKLILSTIFIFTFISCGSDNNTAPTNIGPSQDEDLDQFVSGLIAADKNREGNYVTFEYPHFYKLDNVKECVYYYDLTNTVDHLDHTSNVVTISTDISNILSSRRNSTSCPITPPNIIKNRVKSLTIAEVYKSLAKTTRRFLNPQTLCTDHSYWISCNVIARYNTTYKKVDARYVEAELQHENGEIYLQRAWIARKSLLHGVFEYEIVNKRNNNYITYKTYIVNQSSSLQE